MTEQKIPKIQTYPEFIKAKCERECTGCLELVIEYVETQVPTDFADYESLGVPRGLLGQYYELMFRQTVGERNL